MEIEERFWSKVDWDLGDTERCWPWTASKMYRGYGQFRLGRVSGRPVVTRAHRLAYELEFGPIPEVNERGEPLHIDHTCHDPMVCRLGEGCPHRACCNPHHLKLTTNRENHTQGRAVAVAGATASERSRRWWAAMSPERRAAQVEAVRRGRWG